MKRIDKKGFTLLEVIIVLAIISVFASFTIPSFGGYIDKSMKLICKNNISTMQRLFKTYKAENPECTLEEAFAGSYGELSENFSKTKCPAGGVYSVSDGIIVCSIHSDDSDPGGEDPPATYPGTDIVLGDNIWPIEPEFEETWSTQNLAPTGIFQYDDGEYYVIVRDIEVNWSQAQSGPGGLLYLWYVTHRITGRFVTFEPGEIDKTVVRGDMCKIGDDYYVFIDGGSVGHPPSSSPAQWYLLP